MRKKTGNRVKPVQVMLGMLAAIMLLVFYFLLNGEDETVVYSSSPTYLAPESPDETVGMGRTPEKESQVRRLDEYMIRFTGLRTIE